jgi:hypothetical protein
MAGLPNIFKADASRNLNKIFPPVRGGFELVEVLSGYVQLTHDFLSTIPYLAVSIYDAVGSVDAVNLVQAVPVPDGYIWVVDEMHVFTDDGTSRELQLNVNYVSSAGTFVVRVFKVDSGVTSSAWPIGRRLILPPGAFFNLTVPVISAGKKLRFMVAYLLVPAGQFVPKS